MTQQVKPSILIAIGHRAQRTLQDYASLLPTRIPSTLSVVITLDSQDQVLQEAAPIQRIVLSAPEFEKDEWPSWLPNELVDMPVWQRARTRGWMRAALLQQADDVQEFFISSVPRLSSLDTIEQLSAAGLSLAGDSVCDIYLLTDLSEQFAGSIFMDVADLVNNVCQQLGLSTRTTGLFYLPDATSPAPAEEAIAYAALKELEQRVSTRRDATASTSALTTPYQPCVFDGGCYLIDTMNELGYVLQNESWQIQAASQWLYAMTCLNMALSVYGSYDRRYISGKLRGKSRIYSSFGIAVCTIPQHALEDWMVTRLGHSIVSCLCDPQSSTDVQKRADAFVTTLGLKVDALKGRLRYDSSPDIEDALSPLRRTGLRRIELRTRQVLQTLREKYLPAFQTSLVESFKRIQDEVRETLDETIQAMLEDSPSGGIATAREFLKSLAEVISEQQQEVQEQRKQQKVDLKRSLTTVSNAHYALASVMQSIPPWPIVLLSVITMMVLPSIYGYQLAKVIRPSSPAGANLMLGVLVVGVLATLAFVGLRLFRQKNIIAAQHIEMLYERFGIESASPINRTMNSIYESIQEDIKQVRAKVEALTANLQSVSTYLEAKYAGYAEFLKKQSSPGPIRSVVSLDRAEAIYQEIISGQVVSRRQRSVPVVEQLVTDFVKAIGPIALWRQECMESGQPLDVWFRERLIAFGRNTIGQKVPPMVAEDFLSEGSELDRALEQIVGGAQPLWNYDPQVLRQAKTQRLSLVRGMLNPTHYARLKQLLPQMVPVNVNESRDLIILNVHHGMPLFALRRLGEYRTHYATMLQHSKFPIHVTHEMALADDLFTTRPKSQLAPAMLFAVGLALNLLRRDPGGRYIAPRGRDVSVRLSSNKTHAAALLGMDKTICKELQRRLDDVISSHGRGAVQSALEEYMAVASDLEDWEVKEILAFCRACGSEAGDESAVLE